MGYSNVKLKEALEFAVERERNRRPRPGASIASRRPWVSVLTALLGRIEFLHDVAGGAIGDLPIHDTEVTRVLLPASASRADHKLQIYFSTQLKEKVEQLVNIRAPQLRIFDMQADVPVRYRLPVHDWGLLIHELDPFHGPRGYELLECRDQPPFDLVKIGSVGDGVQVLHRAL
jgi:hypothetical protein